MVSRCNTKCPLIQTLRDLCGQGETAFPLEPLGECDAMAIYHLRASVISRSAGRSATAAAAYRSGTEIEDRRTGLSFDYAAKGGVEYTEILAPDHAPDWVSDRLELWNRVEESETRKNSQVAREIRVALPSELSAEERAELVRGFCQSAFVERGMVADFAIHEPSSTGDERNYHAHIMLPTREIDAEGFTTKNRDWNGKDVLEDWRSSWAEASNEALERSGQDERIDHRTLEAQRNEAQERATEARERGDEEEALRETVRAVSLDRKPLPQLSPGAWQMKERGHDVPAVSLWREVKEQAVEVARVAEELAGQAREWIERTAERARERLQLEQPEPAHAGGGIERPADLAAQMRTAWEKHQSRIEEPGEAASGKVDKPEPAEIEAERDDNSEPQSLADRMREAAKGIDRDAATVAAERVRTLREGREADRQQKEMQEREAEKQRLQERNRGRDRGMDIDYDF